MPYPEQKDCVAEMYRLIKENGAIFYNNKNRVQAGLLQDRREIVKDFPLRQIITWKRNGAKNFNSGYFLPTTEQIYRCLENKTRDEQSTPRFISRRADR